MNIVGFHFTRISAERKRSAVGTININNNIALQDVTEAKMGVGDRGAVRVSFLFTSKYAPDFATLTLEGDVLVLMETTKAKETIEQWGKGRKLNPALAQVVMNHLLDRCNIQALLLARDLGLPSPVPLPKVQMRPAQAAGKEPVTTTKVTKKKGK